MTQIGQHAFKKCSSLSSITIPDSVTKIDFGAFYGCSGLSKVYYESSEDDWNNIKIGSGNSALTKAEIIYSLKNPEPLTNLIAASKTTAENNTPTVEITLNQAVNGELIAVQYDKDGNLISVSTEKTVPENNTYTIEISDADSPVKIMYFDSLQNIKPISLTAEIK